MSNYYPQPGTYRLVMDNPPPNPGPATKFATNNGVGIQVTAVGSDDDRSRQRWYVQLNNDGTGVKIYNGTSPSGPALVSEQVDSIDCIFLINQVAKEWTLKYVNEANPAENDDKFYIYSSDLQQYFGVHEYGAVVKTGNPQTTNEYWQFIGARNTLF